MTGRLETISTATLMHQHSSEFACCRRRLHNGMLMMFSAVLSLPTLLAKGLTLHTLTCCVCPNLYAWCPQYLLIEYSQQGKASSVKLLLGAGISCNVFTEVGLTRTMMPFVIPRYVQRATG
jgi:hypothetical protein